MHTGRPLHQENIPLCFFYMNTVVDHSLLLLFLWSSPHLWSCSKVGWSLDQNPYLVGWTERWKLSILSTIHPLQISFNRFVLCSLPNGCHLHVWKWSRTMVQSDRKVQPIERSKMCHYGNSGTGVPRQTQPITLHSYVTPNFTIHLPKQSAASVLCSPSTIWGFSFMALLVVTWYNYFCTEWGFHLFYQTMKTRRDYMATNLYSVQ